MRSRILTAALVASAMAGSAAAAESDNTGVYIGLGVGLATLQSTDIGYYDAGGTFGGSGATDRADGSLRFKSAAEFSGLIGYDFGPIRADLQLSYARNKVKSLDIVSINGAPVTLDPADIADVCDYLEADGCSASGNSITFDGGRLRRLSALASAWVDFPTGSVVTPYVGGGLGISGFEIDGEGKGRFAWQLGAGAAFAVSKTVAVTLDYRYRSANGANIAYDATSGFDVGRLRSHSFATGLRFTF
ncbi:outer membrane protein [Polymorphobacter fuscus]|nr:outer membrane beta-barrel protein [Polymorphobacter fuscus]NJC08996.1 opacity protein-like surface antigen [Polymorphobacter fuscus]